MLKDKLPAEEIPLWRCAEISNTLIYSQAFPDVEVTGTVCECVCKPKIRGKYRKSFSNDNTSVPSSVVTSKVPFTEVYKLMGLVSLAIEVHRKQG
jgi:hypothetical protein